MNNILPKNNSINNKNINNACEALQNFINFNGLTTDFDPTLNGFEVVRQEQDLFGNVYNIYKNAEGITYTLNEILRTLQEANEKLTKPAKVRKSKTSSAKQAKQKTPSDLITLNEQLQNNCETQITNHAEPPATEKKEVNKQTKLKRIVVNDALDSDLVIKSALLEKLNKSNKNSLNFAEVLECLKNLNIQDSNDIVTNIENIITNYKNIDPFKLSTKKLNGDYKFSFLALLMNRTEPITILRSGSYKTLLCNITATCFSGETKDYLNKYEEILKQENIIDNHSEEILNRKLEKAVADTTKNTKTLIDYLCLNAEDIKTIELQNKPPLQLTENQIKEIQSERAENTISNHAEPTINTQAQNAPINATSEVYSQPNINNNNSQNESVAIQQNTINNNNKRLPFNCENIPREIKELKQWCIAWLDDKEKARAKAPRQLLNNFKMAKTNAPETWNYFSEYEKAVKEKTIFLNSYYAGIVLTNNDPFVIIDLDDKDSTSQSERESFSKIINDFDSYTEISSGGKGYHIILKCNDLPKEKLKHNRKGAYEIYKDERFIILTGNIVNNQSEIKEVEFSQIEKFISEYISNNNNNAKLSYTNNNNTLKNNTKQSVNSTNKLADDDAIKRILENTKGTNNGVLFTNEPYKYIPDESLADFTCFCEILKITNDYNQVVRIFQNFTIGKREKASREDYLRRTYENALNKISETAGGVNEKITPSKIENNLFTSKLQPPQNFPFHTANELVRVILEKRKDKSPDTLIFLLTHVFFSCAIFPYVNVYSFNGDEAGELPTNLSCLLLSQSSTGKTSMQNLLLRPLNDAYNYISNERYKIEMEIKRLEREILEKSGGGLIANDKNKKNESEISFLNTQIQILKDKMPKYRIDIINQGTPEGKLNDLKENPCALICDDEAHSAFTTKNEEIKKKEFKLITECINGITSKHTTKTQGKIQRMNVRVAHAYQTQLKSFNKLGSEFTLEQIGQGSFPRMLFNAIYEFQRKPKKREGVPTKPQNSPEMRVYHNIMFNTLIHNEVIRDNRGVIIPHEIHFYGEMPDTENGSYDFYFEKEVELYKFKQGKTPKTQAIYDKVLENSQRLATVMYFGDWALEQYRNKVDPFPFKEKSKEEWEDIDKKIKEEKIIDIKEFASTQIPCKYLKDAYEVVLHSAKSLDYYTQEGEVYETEAESLELARKILKIFLSPKDRQKYENGDINLLSVLKSRLHIKADDKEKQNRFLDAIGYLRLTGILLADEMFPDKNFTINNDLWGYSDFDDFITHNQSSF